MARMNGGRRGNKVSLGGGGSAEGGCQTKGGSDMVPRARRSSSQVARVLRLLLATVLVNPKTSPDEP